MEFPHQFRGHEIEHSQCCGCRDEEARERVNLVVAHVAASLQRDDTITREGEHCLQNVRIVMTGKLKTSTR